VDKVEEWLGEERFVMLRREGHGMEAKDDDNRKG
jgi:hypothetical protein